MSGPVDYARAIEQMARDRFRFVDEPDELLIDPVVQLNQLDEVGIISGDCDDSAMFTATLLRSLGIPARFKAIQAAPDGSYQHVFTEFYEYGLGRWIPIDPTIPGIPVYDAGDFIVEEV